MAVAAAADDGRPPPPELDRVPAPDRLVGPDVPDVPAAAAVAAGSGFWERGAALLVLCFGSGPVYGGMGPFQVARGDEGPAEVKLCGRAGFGSRAPVRGAKAGLGGERDRDWEEEVAVGLPPSR